MKQLKLDCITRVKLDGILGAAHGNIARLEPLREMYKEVRFSDEEQKEMTPTPMPNGMMHWSWPNTPGWGYKEALVEDGVARAVLMELEQFQGYQIADLESDWLQSIKEQLKAPSVEPYLTSKEGRKKK